MFEFLFLLTLILGVFSQTLPSAEKAAEDSSPKAKPQQNQADQCSLPKPRRTKPAGRPKQRKKPRQNISDGALISAIRNY